MTNEKQIYKESLLEVVNYLNNNDEDSEVYSKKNIRLSIKNNKKRKNVLNFNKSNTHNDTDVKRNKNANFLESKKDSEIVCQKNKCNTDKKQKIINIETNYKKDTINKEEIDSQKLTRKQRRQLKIKSRGEGLSSKEFMKIVKEKDGKKLHVDNKMLNKNHMPSKFKNEYPKQEKLDKRRITKIKHKKKSHK